MKRSEIKRKIKLSPMRKMESFKNLKINSNSYVVKIFIKLSQTDIDVNKVWEKNILHFKDSKEDIQLENIKLINKNKSCKTSIIFKCQNATINIFKGSFTIITKETKQIISKLIFEICEFFFKEFKIIKIELLFTHNTTNRQFKLKNPKKISQICLKETDFFYTKSLKSPCILFKIKIPKEKLFEMFFLKIVKMDNGIQHSNISGNDLIKNYNIIFKDKFITFQAFNTKSVVITSFDETHSEQIYKIFLNLLENKDG